MASDQVRRQRVANGSRRKRDLAAAAPSFDSEAYAAKHFPDAEPSLGLRAAIFIVRKRHGDRGYPDPAEVRALAEERHWLREREQ